MNEQEHQQAVGRLFDAIKLKDVGVLEDLLHPEFVQETRDPDGIVDETELPISASPRRVTAIGEAVVAEVEWEFPGLTAEAVSVFEFVDGKIATQIDYFGRPVRFPGPGRDTRSDDESKAVVERYWGAMIKRDLDAVHELRSEDFVMEWPQSGERVRGRDNARKIEETYAETPKSVDQYLEGGAGTWVARTALDYDGQLSYVLSVITVTDGRVSSQTDYFGDPFEAPDWRAQWVERM